MLSRGRRFLLLTSWPCPCPWGLGHCCPLLPPGPGALREAHRSLRQDLVLVAAPESHEVPLGPISLACSGPSGGQPRPQGPPSWVSFPNSMRVLSVTSSRYLMDKLNATGPTRAPAGPACHRPPGRAQH